jgi:hypothetical protein
VLNKLRKIPVTSWNYISEGKQVRHLGPMAENFFAQFELGTGNTSIGNSGPRRRRASQRSRNSTSSFSRRMPRSSGLQNEVKTLRRTRLISKSVLQVIEQAIVKQQ